MRACRTLFSNGLISGKPTVSNTWYMSLKISDTQSKESLTLVFYFERLYQSKVLKFLEAEKRNPKGFKTKKFIPPAIKLYISARRNGLSLDIDKNVDLVNIGTYRDQLSFGIIDRTVHREAWQKPKLESKTENPGTVIRRFIDQILDLYFDVKTKN